MCNFCLSQHITLSEPFYSIHAHRYCCTFIPCLLVNHFIHVGSEWRVEIESAIDQSLGVIPIITNNYLNSKHCIQELDVADDKNKMIFPIIHERDVDYKRAPGVQMIISQRQYVYFRPGMDDYNQSLRQLADGLNQLASSKQMCSFY